MKLVLALSLFVVAVSADAPLTNADSLAELRRLPVIERTEIRDDSNQISLRYRTQEGINVALRGVLVPTADGKDYVLEQEGSYGHVGPDGVYYETKYTADRNGFHASGAHLPAPPAPTV